MDRFNISHKTHYPGGVLRDSGARSRSGGSVRQSSCLSCHRGAVCRWFTPYGIPACIHTLTLTHTHTYAYTLTHTHTPTYTPIHAYTLPHTYTHSRIYTPPRTHASTPPHTHASTPTHTPQDTSTRYRAHPKWSSQLWWSVARPPMACSVSACPLSHDLVSVMAA